MQTRIQQHPFLKLKNYYRTNYSGWQRHNNT